MLPAGSRAATFERETEQKAKEIEEGRSNGLLRDWAPLAPTRAYSRAGWPSAWVLIIRPRVVRSVATGGEALDTRGRMLFKKFRSLTVIGKGAGKVSGWRSRPSVKRRL